MFRNLQLGTRLTLIVTATVVTILTVITFFEINASDSALRNQTVTRFSTKSSEVINLINQEFQRIQGNARLFATAIGNVGDPNVSNELRQSVANYVSTGSDGLATRYSVLRPDGKVGVLTLENPLVTATYEWRVYSFASDIPNRNDVLEGRFYTPITTEQVSWFLQQETFYDEERQPSITVVAPFEQNGIVAGLVWVDIPREQFQRKITQLLNDEGLLADTNSGYAALVDETGNLVTIHNLSIRNYELQEDVREVVRNLRDTGMNDVAQRTDPITQQDSFMNVRTFASNNWRFLTILPISEIPVLPSGVLGPVVIISTIGVLMLVFIINYFTRNSVAEPLQRLGNAAQEIGAGDLRYFIPHRERHDEIGRLSGELENMRLSLEVSYDELSRWGRTLERRVVERTKELDVARESAQTSANELTAIYGESLVVVNESQLKPILDALTARIPALLRSTYSAVWLLNDERDRLQLVASNNRNQREGTVIKVGEGVAGQAVQQATPILVDDYKSYEYYMVLPGGGSEAPFERAIAVPLIYVGRPIGAIVVGRPAEAPVYTESDQRLLSLFANLVSPSVRNAQLFVRMNQAIDEAERANQVKTRFLASVTHELRTPLNLVINNMDFMRIGAFGVVNKEQHERLGQTVRSAEHLLYLINDLLDVSKIEAGEMQLFIQENDIATMLDDSIDNTVSFIDKIDGKANEVEFVVDIDDDLPKIPMDVRRIRQVLTNLLTNAVKFTERGTISLAVRRKADGIEFAVSDTGMGIPEDEAHKLFQAFERTDSAKASMIEGTGLGLPISRYLVEEHGGQLTFTSVVGEGTTFTFTLPYMQPSVTESQIIKRSDPNIAAILASKSQ